MSNPSARKGAWWEAAVNEYLVEHGFPLAERRVPTGQFDRGDHSGVPHVVIEDKNCAKVELAKFLDEALKEANHANARIGVAFIHRKGKGAVADGYAVTDIKTFVSMLVALQALGGL